MKFGFLTGDVDWAKYGGKWISKKLNNGDFDYYLVMELINMEEAAGEETPEKYMVTLQSVSISEAGPENLKSAARCCGLELKDLKNDQQKIMALSDYGVYAQIWCGGGNNFKKLLKEAHKQAFCAEHLFGFYMDKRENLIGNTGWDFIRGDIGFKQQKEASQ